MTTPPPFISSHLSRCFVFLFVISDGRKSLAAHRSCNPSSTDPVIASAFKRLYGAANVYINNKDPANAGMNNKDPANVSIGKDPANVSVVEDPAPPLRAIVESLT
jgi:hypothetical protein